MFDMVLLHSEEDDSVLCEAVLNEKSKNVQPNDQSKRSINLRANRRKTGGKRGCGGFENSFDTLCRSCCSR